MHTVSAKLFVLLVANCCFLLSANASGLFFEGDRLLVQTSAWTRHYDKRPYHNNKQELINLEWIAPVGYRFAWQTDPEAVRRVPWAEEIQWLAGLASFKNSFSQRSTFIYAGGRYDFFASGATRLYGKASVGLLHGYRGEYKDNIPFNHFGVAPAILPAFGVEHRRLNLELIPFGAAGVMVNVGIYAF
jgi:hypothetical protein